MKLGIITDIHENIDKLSESIRTAESYNCDELICLGDIVGYDHRFYGYHSRRSAKRCLEMIKKNCKWIVAGNHDLFAAQKLPSYSDGFIYPENWFMQNAEERKKNSLRKVWSYEGDVPNDLDHDDIQFMKSLPEYIMVSLSGCNCLFSHYIFPDFTGSTTKYIERNRHLNDHWEFMNHHEITLSFSGHSHTCFAGFAYKRRNNRVGSFLKAIHSVPYESINLGEDMVAVLLPPLSGERGRSGISILDTDFRKLQIIPVSDG